MLISFIVVALNAHSSLPSLLEDLEHQRISASRVEVLLVDSCSRDDTREIMNGYAARSRYAVTVLDNPRRWLASGCNVALHAARGDRVIRLDAHARIPENFLARASELLDEGRDIVGGAVTSAPAEGTLAAVLTSLDASRFGGGAAPFRNQGEAREVDTLAYAMYRMEVYRRVGDYDERLRRTEDNEIHYRMKKAGYRFYFDPSLSSFHAARTTLSGMIRQKWGNGLWVGRTLYIEPRCFALRHFVPAMFVAALLLCGLLSPLTPLPLFCLLFVYLLLDLYFTVLAAVQSPRGKLAILLLDPFLFLLLHLCYGLGTLTGLLTPPQGWRTP